MIAPRSKNESTTTPDADDRLRKLIEELRASDTAGYGVWREVQTDLHALEMVITEISQVVLARGIRVTVRETGHILDLKVSNRHLLELGGVVSVPNEASSQQVFEALHQVLRGARTLKFEVKDHSPMLSKATRSWPHDILLHDLNALRMQTKPSTRWDEVLEEIKSVAESWLQQVAQSAPISHGHEADVHMLERVAEFREASPLGVDQLGRRAPHLGMLELTPHHVFIECAGEGDMLLAVIAAEKRAQIVALWQKYSALANEA